MPNPAYHCPHRSPTMPKIIDGKKLSEEILADICKQVRHKKVQPGLAAILIGDDPSSHLYVKLKKAACEKCDINFHRYLFENDYKTQDIIDVINFLNNDEDVNGILVQLPLPKGLDTDKIIAAIDPQKDVDGFHPENLKKLKNCDNKIVSPLIGGIMELIKATGEKIANKNICILCNHKIFGEPFHCFFDKSNTIKIVTLKDKDYKKAVSEADVLIVSIGKPKFIKQNKIKDGAIIIDVGINKVKEKVVGDVDLKAVIKKVKFITPVPGGVGPMTVAMLLKNLISL